MTYPESSHYGSHDIAPHQTAAMVKSGARPLVSATVDMTSRVK